jgi:hypothetical protein
MRHLPRAVAAALLAALAGAAALVVTVGWHPAVVFEMDRELPAYVSGFYPLERDDQTTFAWTREHVDITLAGADRRVPWTCEVRFKGARPSADMQPDVEVAVDGRRAGVWRATNDFQDVRVAIPATPTKPGLALSLTSSQLYEPGPSDRRKLGVQVDRLACAPASGVMLPPRRAIGAVAAAAGILGAGLGLTGITAGSAIGGAALLAAGQAVVLPSGGGLYGTYSETMVRLAAALAVGLILMTWLVQAGRKDPLRNTARFVLSFSAGALYLQLLALLHPAKSFVDAMFHAHRFDSVLAGRWYFTQLSTSATPFPYAIGLYLFSAPWAFLTTNHVALLRVVVSSAEMLAGALLYVAVVRAWGSRLAGAVAAALFTLVPVSYEVIGNANLTHAFGQAVAVVTVTALAIHAERLRRPWVFVTLLILATLGVTSHISTLVLLPSILVVSAALFRWLGGQALKGAFTATILITVLALAASTAIYWGHFGDVYRVQLQRLQSAVSSTAAPDAAGAAPSTPDRPVLARMGKEAIPLSGRVVLAASQTVGSLGWPIFLLALLGAWRWFTEGGRGRLDLVIGAWVVVWLGFVAISVLSPGNKAYQQDAYEFISRVIHTTMPAAVLLAGRGAAYGWRANTPARAGIVVLLGWAVVVGIRHWLQWLV